VLFVFAHALIWKKMFALETYGPTGKQGFRNKNHTWETSNVSEFGGKHFCFPGSKFCFRNNVSMGGLTVDFI
jgi:hypothetical protein